MRQQEPMVFLLNFLYLSAVACIYEETKLGSCWRKDILSVEGQASITKSNFFLSWLDQYAVTEWPLIDTPTSTHGVITSFSLFKCCYLHFCRNKIGLMLAHRYIRVKGQA